MNDKILNLLNESPVNPVEVHGELKKMNTVDLADVFERLSGENVVRIFRLLPKSIAADVFSYMEPETQKLIVEGLTDVELGKVITELFVDDAVDFIEEMPANVVKRVLKNVGEDMRQTINQFLQYPDDSAGSIMTTEYVGLREYNTVSEAFDTIRTTGVDKETIYTCLVMRSDRFLVGTVSARKLMLAEPDDKIIDIMNTNFLFANTTDDQEKIADMFRRYDLMLLPVVDKEQRLVGIVTIDDVVDVIEKEATEDIEKMAALNPSEEPYLKTKVTILTKNRILWLLVLMFSAMLTGSIISNVEDYFTTLPMLAAFIPMLMNTGGSAGSQASTLIIRGMALGEIKINFKMLMFIIWREIRIGFLCGAILGIVNFLRLLLMGEGDYLLALTVTLSLFVTVIIAKSVGCTLPILAKKLKIDPAIMATPLITTIVDAISLVVYFWFVSIFLIA
ncbi:MAG: magnesium transporter [Oscillospiraceae bacterium]|nr:magnesium transporter [Oscillospiraceae bacterium]